MPNYKDSGNQIHFIDSDDHAHLLPAGCVEISDAEADHIRAASIVQPTYQELRAAEYPPVTDYMDAMVKGDASQQQAYIDKCLAIKAKYPKP